MASAENVLVVDEEAQRRRAMDPLQDHDAAFLELLNDFMRERGEVDPVEEAMQARGTDDLLSRGPEDIPMQRMTTFIINSSRSTGLLPRLHEHHQALSRLAQAELSLPGQAAYPLPSSARDPLDVGAAPALDAGVSHRLQGWSPHLGPPLHFGAPPFLPASFSSTAAMLPGHAGGLRGIVPQAHLNSPWTDLSSSAGLGQLMFDRPAPLFLDPVHRQQQHGPSLYGPIRIPQRQPPQELARNLSAGSAEQNMDGRASIDGASLGSRGAAGQHADVLGGEHWSKKAPSGLNGGRGSQGSQGGQPPERRESGGSQGVRPAASPLQTSAGLQSEAAPGKGDGILGSDSLLTELRSRKRPRESSEASEPVPENGRRLPSRRSGHLPAALKARVVPPCSDREDLGAKKSLLEQLLRDAMGNLSAEQEQGLLAGMAERVDADAPSSPNAEMREESILAGLGVIAPEEIGLRRNKSAPVRPSGGGLLAQLRQQREGELRHETPARSGEGSGLLAQLRGVSSSEEAATRAGSTSTIQRQLSTRDSGPLLRKLRVEVAREAGAVGLGGRKLAEGMAGFQEGGVSGSPQVPQAGDSRGSSMAGTPKSQLGQFGSGNLAVLAARGQSEEPARSGSMGHLYGLAQASPLEAFGSGSVAAELASGRNQAAAASGLPSFGLGRVAADLARSDSMVTSAKPSPATWRVQSGGSATVDPGPPSQPASDAIKVTSKGSAAPASQAGPSIPPGRRVPPVIPISRFSLDGVPGWRPPPSPPHTGASPPRAASNEPDDSGGSRMWTVHSLNSWAQGEKGKGLQSRSSLHSRSSIQSQPSFHSWAGYGNPAGPSDSPLRAMGDAGFAARWGKASASLDFPSWPKRSPSPGRASRAARASTLRGAFSHQEMLPPSSPPKTHSSDGSPRNRLADFVSTRRGARPPSDQGSPAARTQPSGSSGQRSPDPTPPRSPETGGSGSASPSGVQGSLHQLQRPRIASAESVDDFANSLLHSTSPATSLPPSSPYSDSGRPPPSS